MWVKSSIGCQMSICLAQKMFKYHSRIDWKKLYADEVVHQPPHAEA